MKVRETSTVKRGIMNSFQRISAAVCQDESLSILTPVRSCLPIGGWDVSLWYHDVDRLIVALN